jgi:hypothetical protein
MIRKKEVGRVDAVEKRREVNPMMHSKNYEHKKSQKVIFGKQKYFRMAALSCNEK